VATPPGRSGRNGFAEGRTSAARQHIRKNALQHLHQEITITRRDGPFTFEECLAQLVRRGVFSLDEARARAMHREELDGLISNSRET